MTRRVNMADFITIDDDGSVRLDLTKITPRRAAAIESLSWSNDGNTFDLRMKPGHIGIRGQG